MKLHEYKVKDIDKLQLNERQRRIFFAEEALSLGRKGVSIVCREYGVSKNTVYRGIKEYKEGKVMNDGRIRKPGGGRKPVIAVHPEYVKAFDEVVSNAGIDGGLPQDENVRMLFYSASVIQMKLEDYHIHISIYIINQIIKMEGYRKRKPLKCVSMKESKNRDAQFKKISETRNDCKRRGVPILSMDTKKKELVGPFRRDGRVYCDKAPKVKDHDFESFATGKIIPHGIYDVERNVGYMSFGTSHDTAEFACDNIKHFWNSDIHHIYPHADTIMLLCDGGGSNSSTNRLFKQRLIRLAKELRVNIIVAHYPPYTSKWNPIEHRLFSQITRTWKGISFNSVWQASELAAETRTKTGLCVFTVVNEKEYDTDRKVDDDFEEMCNRHIIFDKNLPKWNYTVLWQGC